MAAAHAAGGAVVPVFIFDDAILGGRFASPARTQFLLDCLAELDAELRTLGYIWWYGAGNRCLS